MAFHIKRIYDPAQPADGERILVDRLWPRGVSKARAKVDEWMKDIAPSTPLRQEFNHKPERFAEFTQAYNAELARNPLLADLRKRGRGKTITLLYGARDPKVNHAVVLLAALQRGGATKKKAAASAAA